MFRFFHPFPPIPFPIPDDPRSEQPIRRGSLADLHILEILPFPRILQQRVIITLRLQGNPFIPHRATYPVYSVRVEPISRNDRAFHLVLHVTLAARFSPRKQLFRVSRHATNTPVYPHETEMVASFTVPNEFRLIDSRASLHSYWGFRNGLFPAVSSSWLWNPAGRASSRSCD